jgi:hypothetical protein
MRNMIMDNLLELDIVIVLHEVHIEPGQVITHSIRVQFQVFDVRQDRLVLAEKDRS